MVPPGSQCITINLSWTYIAHPTPQASFPAPDAGQKKFNSRLVVPIFLTSVVQVCQPIISPDKISTCDDCRPVELLGLFSCDSHDALPVG